MSTPVAPNRPEPLFVHMVATYRSLRRLIVGVALTFLALLLAYRYHGGETIPRYSISAYYHNQGYLFGLVPVRDLFVGAFAAVALMLYAYKGYKWRESRVLNIAAVGLLVVAICPMEWVQPTAVAKDVAQSLERNHKRAEFIADSKVSDAAKAQAQELKIRIEKSTDQAGTLVKEVEGTASQDHWPKTFKGWAHYIGAFVFFFGIAYVCWVHAHDTLRFVQNQAMQKLYKALYLLTGILMGLVPVAATVLYLIGFQSTVFWVEFGGVGVFTLYWVIKSRELSGVR